MSAIKSKATKKAPSRLQKLAEENQSLKAGITRVTDAYDRNLHSLKLAAQEIDFLKDVIRKIQVRP